ncbi:hypothetical protein QQS21_009840 [Conoideocrella luteorostrata]|uniref:SMP-30/Gluconolactonase/LRE-like region domain-containing protein n=1 Tax=Conoideocrella luteorostrata TaxID=1105319 RepID=A0AAJ0CKM4_9HYPO|nr:hypothetical protein QQS21_009840 [Conoideocrella luteorostrata]
MYAHLKITALSLLAIAATASAAALGSRTANIELPHRLVHQFPVGTWIENIAVRRNGNLLLTGLSPNATLYEVSHPDSKKPSTKTLFTLSTVSSLLGIAEVSNDRFAFLGGNFTTTEGGVKGTWGVWTVDFTHHISPKPRLAASLPDAILPNGMTTIPGHKELALVADSTNGLVYTVNVDTGKVQVTHDFPEMKPTSHNPPAIGINGLHIRRGYLYFTNLLTHTLFKLKINNDGTTASGAKVETVAVVNSTALDDFTFGPGSRDIAWLTTNPSNSVVAVSRNGQAKVVAGGPSSSTVPGATACQFGRKNNDGKILYVTTSGGETKGGTVQAIDTTKFCW